MSDGTTIDFETGPVPPKNGARRPMLDDEAFHEPDDFDPSAGEQHDRGPERWPDGTYKAIELPDERRGNSFSGQQPPDDDEDRERYKRAQSVDTGGMTAETMIARMRAEGALVRQPTGIAEIDRLTRGGLVFGRRYALTGAPGAGKTFCAACVGGRALLDGLVVGNHCVDEDPEDVFARYISILAPPYHLRDCEEREPHVLDDIEAKLVDVKARLLFFGGDVSIDHAMAQTAEHAKKLGSRACYIGDSIQTLQCEASRANPKLSETQVIEANVRTIRALAGQHKLIALFTSEMNRGAYRNRDQSTNSVALAAAKGSSAIEYSAQGVFALRSLPHEPDRIEVEVAKNRGGEKAIFYLRLDRRAHALLEDVAPEPVTQGVDGNGLTQQEAAVLSAIAAHPGMGKTELRVQLRAAKQKIGVEAVDAAVLVLKSRRLIEDRFVMAKTRKDSHFYAIAKEPGHEG